MSSYLREKGLKFAYLIEVQFYVNQLAQHLGERFTDTLKKEFIAAAKKIRPQSNLNFFKVILPTEEVSAHLYLLAQQYFEANKPLPSENYKPINGVI